MEIFFSNSKEISNDFLCFLCKKILLDPVSCLECTEAHFCRKCIENHFNSISNTTCPSCKQTWSNKGFKCLGLLLKFYHNLPAICGNKDCSVSGKLEFILKHYKDDCKFTLIECVNFALGCKWKGKNSEYAEHKKICSLNSFTTVFQNFEEKLLKINEFTTIASMNSEKIATHEKEILNLKKFIDVQEKEITDLKEINKTLIDKLKILEDFKSDFSEELMILKEKRKYNAILKKYYGILKNINMKEFIDIGFKLYLQKGYDYKNTFEELLSLKEKSKLIILAGKRTDEKDDNILLGAMGLTNEVLKETFGQSEAHEHNGTYWYFCRQEKSKSMGFSKNSKVELFNADAAEVDGAERLSWHLTIKQGGYRLGNFKNISNDFEKLVLYME